LRSEKLLVFEDASWPDLAPLADLLPVPALAFGASDLASRWQVALEAEPIGCEARAGAMACWSDAPAAGARVRADEPVLVVNAACLPGTGLETALREAGTREPTLFQRGGRVLGAVLPFGRLEAGLGRGAGLDAWLRALGLRAVEVQARLVERPWQMIEWNAEALEADLATRAKTGGRKGAGEVHASAVLLEPRRIVVEPGARVEPLAVLDAREGHVWIESDVVVGPHTVVKGPCVVRRRSQLLGGLVARSTIGPDCRIAGEVEECIWQGRSNKRHHGFVGHSIVGEWCNLGALTTTSDLKNNYGTVRIHAPSGEIETGLTKVGSLLGAHVKTGIGTLLPTGAWVGTGANLFGGGRFVPKHVPAFGWWDGERMDVHRIEAFLGTARTALGRRGVELSGPAERALRALFEASAGRIRAS
jgi:UDP-N-acetylglucosamine diphosphorylase/glucosamine-1-phosphate N-acetyltransferase